MSEDKAPEGDKTEVNPTNNEGGGQSAEYWKGEAKRAFEQRQALKAELEKRDKESQERDTARLKETQKWEEAYNKDVPTMKAELETYKSKWTAFEEKLTARITEKEAKLSKDAKEEYEKFISKLPLEDRDEWLNVKVGVVAVPPPTGGRPGNVGNPIPFEKLPFEERIKLARQYGDNPTVLHKQMAG